MCIRDRSNSLFEDNAEFGFGMTLAQEAIRGRLMEYVEKIASLTDKDDVKAVCENYIATKDDCMANRDAADALIAVLEPMAAHDCEMGQLAKKALADKDYLAKKSMWILGGDGWAYDIGFGEMCIRDRCRKSLWII